MSPELLGQYIWNIGGAFVTLGVIVYFLLALAGFFDHSDRGD